MATSSGKKANPKVLRSTDVDSEEETISMTLSQSLQLNTEPGRDVSFEDEGQDEKSAHSGNHDAFDVGGAVGKSQAEHANDDAVGRSSGETEDGSVKGNDDGGAEAELESGSQQGAHGGTLKIIVS